MNKLLLSSYFVKSINIFLIVSYSITILYVLIIMTTMMKVFDDRKYNRYQALIPFYNVFMLLKLVGIKKYFFLLLFIPIANLILISMINSSLSRIYNKDGLYSLGMFFLPSIFFRTLFKKSKRQKDVEKRLKDINLDDRTFEIDSLLTEEDYKNLNNDKIETENNVDSVFKAQIDTIEDVPTYKAKKNSKDEEFIDL